MRGISGGRGGNTKVGVLTSYRALSRVDRSALPWL